MATSKATGLVEAGGVFKREISVTSETDNILLKIPVSRRTKEESKKVAVVVVLKGRRHGRNVGE